MKVRKAGRQVMGAVGVSRDQLPLTAQQSRERHASCLPPDVPKRHVERRDADTHNPFTAAPRDRFVIHPVPQFGRQLGVGSDDHGR